MPEAAAVSEESIIHPERGFLPFPDPLRRLPPAFDAWEEAAGSLPKLLLADRPRALLEALPPFPADELRDERELRRAMVILSFLGHAYVWGEAEPPDRLPAVLARPWHSVAVRLGRPPVLSYASYALDNWRRLDPEGPIACGNLALLQNFRGGVDEEWFVLIHIEIEAEAAPALRSLLPAGRAAAEGRLEDAALALQQIAESLRRMHATLSRMPEWCDPYIYFHRVRPYIHGWKDNPALPEGLVYEGVDAYGGRPQRFRGETGAQSAMIPAIDAALGIAHADDPLKGYLLEMREYMPPEHRAFLARVESGPSLRECVRSSGSALLRRAYNDCVEGVERFRSLHLEYAHQYILRQARAPGSRPVAASGGASGMANPPDVGTGGTPFARYLKKHRDETRAHAIQAPARE